MNRKVSWDDLRLVLAIAEAGSLSGAGRRLGLSHATVFRRLGKVEGRLGVRLFDRGRRGYAPTLAGEEVAAAARRIECEALQVERRVSGQDLRPQGALRVTTTDTLLVGLLSPIFAAFRRAYPEISLEVALSNDVFSLSKREADVAIRPSLAPPETLVGRKLASIAQAIYGRRDLLASKGGVFDIHAADWVGPDEGMAYGALERWMTEQGLDRCCRYRIDSLLGMFAAAGDGAGLAVLSCYLGDSDRRLTRIGGTIPALSSDLWFLTHPDLRRMARIRVFSEFLRDAVKSQHARLAGAGQAAHSSS